jgi:hypothetical protein
MSITNLLPGDQPFALVRHYLRYFIEDAMGFSMPMAQRTSLGSAYVRVSSFADRDWLVDHSPHQF